MEGRIHDASNQASSPEKRNEYSVKWHSLVSASPSEQIHFWSMSLDSSCDQQLLKTILTTIGMNITRAPLRIKHHFSKVDVNIPTTDRQTVFTYYINFSQHAKIVPRIPCHIHDTMFKTVANFKHFMSYIVQNCTKQPYREFPQPPFNHPLLLTADEQLQVFSECNKAISSDYSHLFSNSLDCFLHPSLLEMEYLPNYFASPEEVSYTKIRDILTKALPRSLQSSRVSSASQHIADEKLKKLWKCLSSDPIFCEHVPNILRNWALLLSVDNELFKCSFNRQDVLLPIIPPDQNELDYISLSSIHQVLKRIQMPFLATDIVSATLASAYCPELSIDLSQRVRCLLYTSPSPRDATLSRMPSSA